ncbi:MAG TPA: DNA polymerase, partial [Phototrophicaceae bacterium]|nr:DNA polymerase [Phototrophicaceae bacterium]
LSTMFGRRRFFTILYRNYTLGERINQQLVQGEERVAINMPIQGTAADIIKRAMIDLHRELEHRQLIAHMILQVHDELVLEVPEAELAETKELVVQIMESACQLNVPLCANAQFGDNWLEMAPC